jgi:hypothetical protein
MGEYTPYAHKMEQVPRRTSTGPNYGSFQLMCERNPPPPSGFPEHQQVPSRGEMEEEGCLWQKRATMRKSL